MKRDEQMSEMRRILESNRIGWPNWFHDQSTLLNHITMRLGYGAIVEIESGYASGGAFPVVGSDQQFELCIFVRPVQGGWQATERVLIPKLQNDSGTEDRPAVAKDIP